MAEVVYTMTDEAPMLATHSLLPVFRRFCNPLGVDISLRDISLSGRILAAWPECLPPGQQVEDHLAWLGEKARAPGASIIKLPNISASVPQLVAAIAELQGQGFPVPDYPASPATEQEKQAAARYGRVLGSAVNPVLREGNSDRRAAPPVKLMARRQEKRSPAMRPYTGKETHVAHMEEGDWYGSEQSRIMSAPDTVSIVLKGEDGSETKLKEGLQLGAGEIIDAATMSRTALTSYYRQQIQECKESGLLFSLHLKATMMKVSDPVLFGHCVRVFFEPVFTKHAALLDQLGVNPNHGLAALLDKLQGHPSQAEVEADIAACYAAQPGLAMVDSSKGITNLHVPSDVIIDASMPCVVRDGGAMWSKEDKLEPVKCLIPDRSYATMYAACLADCAQHGQFDWRTMGHTSNVGLMARKAEEYGSHPTTFQLQAAGKVVVVGAGGGVLLSHPVQEGDMWRMCRTQDIAVKDWVGLAVSRARAADCRAVFWLDPARPHDRNLTDLAARYLLQLDTTGLDIAFLPPAAAMTEACTRARAGLDTITVTGNVLRDYLTDLFPILELGTSAKMLSIVPLLAGGRLLETGAGGSAPKHVEQLLTEGHLRWDSLGEYLALATALQELQATAGHAGAGLLGDTLMEAVQRWLEQDKAPGRRVRELDNRGSNYYLALYWADSLASRDPVWQDLASSLAAAEQEVMRDLTDCQGRRVDIGGYFHPDPTLADRVMRPSQTFNRLMEC